MSRFSVLVVDDDSFIGGIVVQFLETGGYEAATADDGPASGRFCAFLIYPPRCESPSLMVGEIRWSKDHTDGMLAGTKRMFWGSPRERDLAVGGAG